VHLYNITKPNLAHLAGADDDCLVADARPDDGCLANHATRAHHGAQPWPDSGCLTHAAAITGHQQETCGSEHTGKQNFRVTSITQLFRL
jgi:hypothetical protein